MKQQKNEVQKVKPFNTVYKRHCCKKTVPTDELNSKDFGVVVVVIVALVSAAIIKLFNEFRTQ